MWKPKRILCLMVAAAVSGCSSTYFVPPDSETRERFKSSALLVAPYQAAEAIDEPVKGAGEGSLLGAGRGAGAALSFGAGACSAGDGLSCVVGGAIAIGLAVPFAIGGAVIGGASAHSEEEVVAATQSLLSALATAAPDEAFAETLSEQGRMIAGVNLEVRDWEQGWARHFEPLVEEGFDSAIEVRVRTRRLEVIGDIDPDLRPVIVAEARMLSIPDGDPFYERVWLYYGQTQNYFEAAADDAQLLRRDLDSAVGHLASRIVNDLYVSKGAEQKKPPEPGTVVTIDGPVTADSAVQAAAYSPHQNLTDCDDPKNPERPWEGYWQAAQHNATLTLVIDEKWVGGNFEVRGRKYPISGTVDDTGHVKAFYSNSPGPGGGTLAGTFPEIGIPDVGSAGMGRKLAMYQGKVFRLCE